MISSSPQVCVSIYTYNIYNDAYIYNYIYCMINYMWKTHFPISLYILIITYGYIKEYQGIYNLIHKVAKHIVWFRLITHPLYYIFPYVVLRMNIQLSPFWWPGGPWPSKRRIPQKEILEVEIQVVLRHIPQTAAVARGCNNVAANSWDWFMKN